MLEFGERPSTLPLPLPSTQTCGAMGGVPLPFGGLQLPVLLGQRPGHLAHLTRAGPPPTEGRAAGAVRRGERGACGRAEQWVVR